MVFCATHCRWVVDLYRRGCEILLVKEVKFEQEQQSSSDADYTADIKPRGGHYRNTAWLPCQVSTDSTRSVVSHKEGYYAPPYTGHFNPYGTR